MSVVETLKKLVLQHLGDAGRNPPPQIGVNLPEPSSPELSWMRFGNLLVPHGSRSATVAPPDADGEESYVVANTEDHPRAKLSSFLDASVQ
jgi:hypothetical protein